VLRIGDRVCLDAVARTVVGFAGTMVLLSDERGCLITPDLAFVCSHGVFEAAQRQAGSGLASGLLPDVAEPAAVQARWWERHVLEVITGRDPQTEASRPEYDPQTRTVAQREAAKAAELSDSGYDVSAFTVRRKRQRYEARGLAGLVDGRSDRARPVAGRTDPRVVEALRQVIDASVESASRTVEYFRWKVEQVLAAEHGKDQVVMPSRAAFYQLFARVTAGRHVTGSARTRRAEAAKPDGPFGVFSPVRPGELMQIDSTPLDIAVMLDDGVTGRIELTGMIDVATRTVTAAVLRPTTKSVDASLLLARTVTPEPMRPGWADAMRMSRSVLPHRHMLTVDERLEHAAARPVIIPETIVCDQGNVFVSHNFRVSCALLGIDFQPTHPGSPAEKPHIEKMMSSVGTLFCQYVSGYLGSCVERRGRGVDAEPLWSMLELQGLLDEWIVAGWQNRPHDGLRDPVSPGRTFTPNEKYASLVQAAGYIAVALRAEDYIELLPATWRAINAYGVKIGHRSYDSETLNPLRRQPSGVVDKKHLWEVHRDPYDVSRVWVRNHLDGGWITLFWKHLHSMPMPFGELAWNHALAGLRAHGTDPTEDEIAQAAADLLDRAHHGPISQARRSVAEQKASDRDRRVAARTRAAGPVLPAESRPVPEHAPADQSMDLDEEQPADNVIPLGIFDAREEAKTWW
jgi:hypothetical protein